MLSESPNCQTDLQRTYQPNLNAVPIQEDQPQPRYRYLVVRNIVRLSHGRLREIGPRSSASGFSGKPNDEQYVILYRDVIWPTYRGVESAYLSE